MKLKKLILDIETTGLNLNDGDRIIEICCLEICNRQITKNIFHVYINPEKLINKDAFLIHGISDEFVKNKPQFSSISEKFLNFINDSHIIIHNADFDVSFINFELKRLGLNELKFYCKKITDSLKLAQKLFPNKRNSLKFLCKRFNINEERKFHGALLDVILLAKVYLIMTRKQIKLNFRKINYKNKFDNFVYDDNNTVVIKASSYDLYKHQKFFSKIY